MRHIQSGYSVRWREGLASARMVQWAPAADGSRSLAGRGALAQGADLTVVLVSTSTWSTYVLSLTLKWLTMMPCSNTLCPC